MNRHWPHKWGEPEDKGDHTLYSATCCAATMTKRWDDVFKGLKIVEPEEPDFVKGTYNLIEMYLDSLVPDRLIREKILSLVRNDYRAAVTEDVAQRLEDHIGPPSPKFIPYVHPQNKHPEHMAGHVRSLVKRIN